MEDIINIEDVKEKMKKQMRYNKGIFGMDQMFMIIAQIDRTGKGKISSKRMDEFLGKLGIYLSSAEQSELCKYLGKTSENDQISIEQFVNLFKSEIPQSLINKVMEVFNKLKENRESTILNRRNLEHAICIKNHPLCKVFKKDEENTLEQFENSIKFIVMDKNELTENDFLEIHNNMFYTMPVEEVAYFIKYIPELWGIKVNDF